MSTIDWDNGRSTLSHSLSSRQSRQCHIIVSWECLQLQYCPWQFVRQLHHPCRQSVTSISLSFRHGGTVIQQILLIFKAGNIWAGCSRSWILAILVISEPLIPAASELSVYHVEFYGFSWRRRFQFRHPWSQLFATERSGEVQVWNSGTGRHLCV